MRTRQELALLGRRGVDRGLEQVAADAAVVQQRVALGWRAVAPDATARALLRDQELEQLVLGLAHARGELVVGLDARKPSTLLDLLQGCDRWQHVIHSGGRVLSEDAQ